MAIFFQLCKTGGDVVNNPDIKLTDYTIREINWLTSSIDHDFEDSFIKDVEYMVEIKGEIPSNDPGSKVHIEEKDVKELMKWALAPGNSEEAYMKMTIEAYSGGEVQEIEAIDNNNRIRNNAMNEAYVVSYWGNYPDEQYGGKGIFTMIIRNKIKVNYIIGMPTVNNVPTAGTNSVTNAAGASAQATGPVQTTTPAQVPTPAAGTYTTGNLYFSNKVSVLTENFGENSTNAEKVKELKQRLNELGYGPLDVNNGSFLTKTKDAVNKFKSDYGLGNSAPDEGGDCWLSNMDIFVFSHPIHCKA